jgi:hypothetical protein
MNSLIQLRQTTPLFLIVFALGCFAFPQRARAVGPDTDGAIPGSNNGEGIGVLVSRTAGVWNTGTGFEALNHLTAGNQNTATGLRALFSDTNGGFNTATGVYSLFRNSTGFFNSATGAYSLANNTTADYNTANGYSALYFNTEGVQNTATGFGALYHNITGNYNTANGLQALASNTTGSGNIALGWAAGYNLTIGNNNVCIGAGVSGVAGESNTTRIRNIGNTPLAAGVTVLVDAVGGTKLGYLSSSRRNKEDIKPMDNASEAIYCLRPVSFRYKPEIDPTGVQQYGLIAENVEEVNPDLVVRDKEGKAATLRFEAVNAMLLNEFIKEHRKVEELEVALAQQRKDFQSAIAKQDKQIEALASGLQKVSAQVEMSRPSPQTVLNNQ